ncbi:hypothetical protein [Chromobacterium vaccinii]|uniref:hypothetical protein n=1 Tax=Chromobacterium vaccinii TaxID=1108595 RepID=UPI000618362C|nr:hypothetical protein [Chromobacterium vaccinii]
MALTVTAISPVEAYESLLNYFGLKNTPSTTTVIAAVLRRLCGFMCPCPSSALVRMACDSLSALPLERDDLQDRIEIVLDDMIACGDVIELAHMAIASGENHPRWLHCAPPSFVRRNSRIHIFGIAADDARFLPSELRSQVQRDGALRYLDVSAVPDLAVQLSNVGLREMSADAWLINTPKEPFAQVVSRYRKRLDSMGGFGDFPDLSLLLPAAQRRIPYRKRWVSAESASGYFIVRVPQPYGEPLWYFSLLESGIVQRSLLLPLKDSTERACDVAWRLQLALDAEAGYPATYSISPDTEHAGVLLRFDFPLPLAARRRLLILGGRRSENNPYHFWLPAAELGQERLFLREHYWFREQSEDAV